MRRIYRSNLSSRSQKYLQKWTSRLEATAIDAPEPERTSLRTGESDRTWPPKSGTKTLQEIRDRLIAMNGPLAQRCMYCEYSEAGEIDHFEPRSRNPMRTFDWENMLQACHVCNSIYKRDRYQREDGLLPVNPTCEDPRLHIRMLPGCGVQKRTERGKWSNEVFGLDRPFLVKQRKNAWSALTSLIPLYAAHRAGGRADKASEIRKTLTSHPFPSVFIQLLEISKKPQAGILLEDECRHALKNCPEIYDWLPT